jgi:hypothetical protein
MQDEINLIDNYMDENKESPYFLKLFNYYNEKINDKGNQINIENSKIKINNIIKEFNSKNLNEILYPHIKNFINSKLYNDNKEIEIENIIDLYHLILNEINFNETTHEYYSNIISTNSFGIPKELYKEKILSYEMLNSSSFKKFVYILSYWYTLSEIVILNLFLLEKFFGIKFEYNSNYEVIENTENFSKKNYLKLQKFLVNNTTDFASNGIVSKVSDLILYPISNITGINNIISIGKSYVKSYLIGNIFGNLEKNFDEKSNSKEINKINDNIEGLNKYLDDINNKIISLINNEIKIYIYNKLGENKEKYLSKIEELKKEITNLLKAFDDEDNKLKEKEIEDDWIEIEN